MNETAAATRRKRKKHNPDYYRFFEENLINQDADFEIKLYRVVKRGTKRTKFYLRTYTNMIPTEEEIGREYGGGVYFAVSPTENDEEEKEILSKVIYIDESFDTLKAQRDQEAERERLQQERLLYGPPQPQQINPFESISAIMSGVIEPVLKIAMNGKQAAATSNNTGAEKMIEGMTGLFINSMKKINDTMINSQLERIEDLKDRAEPDDGKAQITKQILGVISQFAEGFLNANGAKEKLIRQAILEDPQFQQVQQDPDLLDTIYNEGCEDPQIGTEKMNQLFTKLGIQIEEPPPEPAAQEPAAAAQQ